MPAVTISQQSQNLLCFTVRFVSVVSASCVITQLALTTDTKRVFIGLSLCLSVTTGSVTVQGLATF